MQLNCIQCKHTDKDCAQFKCKQFKTIYNEKQRKVKLRRTIKFPCNQFGGQAPGSEEEIVDFCQSRYGVTFKQFAKVEVNGEKEEPLFTCLKNQKGGVMGKNIKWNFTKFLVDASGKVVDRFAPTTTPDKIEEAINKLL